MYYKSSRCPLCFFFSIWMVISPDCGNFVWLRQPDAMCYIQGEIFFTSTFFFEELYRLIASIFVGVNVTCCLPTNDCLGEGMKLNKGNFCRKEKILMGSFHSVDDYIAYHFLPLWVKETLGKRMLHHIKSKCFVLLKRKNSFSDLIKLCKESKYRMK